MIRLIVRTMAYGLVIGCLATPLGGPGHYSGHRDGQQRARRLPNASVSIDGTSLRGTSGESG